MRRELIKDGYVLASTTEFAFPVPSWTLDLEVRWTVGLSASQRAVLRLADAGLGSTEEFAEAMGFGGDVRLVARAATKMLAAGALAITEGRIIATDLGRRMMQTVALAKRERVTSTAFYHPLDRKWSWKQPSRPARDVIWTIDLAVPVAHPSTRPDVIGDLVAEGVPELAKRAMAEKPPAAELLAFHEVSARLAYELVKVETWEPPHEGAIVRIGLRDGECDELLTRALDGAEVNERRKRLRLRLV